MERRSGTRWPFVIFLLFLCPALVSLAGESQVKLCQWCCVYCCCYLYWCYYFSVHIVVVYTFQHLCWVSTIPLLSFLFFSLLLTYLLSVIVIFSICHLLSFPLFVIFLAVHIPDIYQFCSKTALFEPEKNWPKCCIFFAKRYTSLKKYTLCDLYQLWLFIVCARVWYLLYYWPISGEFQSLKNFTEHQIVDWNFSFFFFLSLIIMSPCSASPLYLQKKSRSQWTWDQKFEPVN